MEQKIDREKKHADVQQFAVVLVVFVFDPVRGGLTEEKTDEESRDPESEEGKQEKQASHSERECKRQYERVEQHQNVHRQKGTAHLPEPLDEKQQDDDGEAVHDRRDADLRVVMKPVGPLNPQLIHVHVPLPFPVAPKNV